jgi:predicted transcriptional regulator
MRGDPVVARWRGVQALELRARGWTYSEIAKELGLSHRSAARKAAVRVLRERAGVAVDVYRVAELLQTDFALSQSWDAALSGDDRAIAVCAQAVAARSMVIHAA